MKRYFSSFLLFLKNKKIPKKEDFKYLLNSEFSILKLFIFLFSVLVISLFLSLAMRLSHKLTVEVPDYGGTVIEGVIGSPRFINPLLATSETDQLLSSLIYSPLVKEDTDGNISSALVENCSVSTDAKRYECSLKTGLVFSDKSPLTISDVIFTFNTKKSLELLKNPTSPWSQISIEATGNQTIAISTTGSTSFLREKLSLGIVPKKIWESIPLAALEESSINMKPIGSGAFVLKDTSYINTLPTEMVLEPNKHSFEKRPYIKKLIIHSYLNQLDLQGALHSGKITDTSALRSAYVDNSIKKNFLVNIIPTKKDVVLMVNKSQSTTSTAKKIASFGEQIDKNAIIDKIENGYGIPLSGESTPSSQKIQVGPLAPTTISIAVQKEDDLIMTAELLSTALKDFGILSTVNVFDQGIFNDQLQLGQYGFVLTSSSDTPDGYQRLVPLYKKSIVHINSKDINAETPKIITMPRDTLRYINNWYTRTDRVWNWFIQK